MDLFKHKILKDLIYSNKVPVFLSLIFFILGGLYVTYPLIFHLSDSIFDKVDDYYVSWIINWDIHSFTTNILNIFNGNVFYPYHNTLAYSETFLVSAVLAFIPTKLIGNPAVAYNINLIFSFISLGFCVYLLSYYITKSHLSSIVAGVVTAFSPYTTTKLMHIQLLGICWVPLSLLFFIMFLDKKQYRLLVLSAIFFVIQVYNSFLPGYFIIFSSFTIFLYYYLNKKIKLRELQFRKIIFITIAVFIVILPIVIPYYLVSKEFGYVRDIRDSIQFANRPEYTLYPGFTTCLANILIQFFYKYDKGPFTYDGFIGLAFFILSGLAILYRIIKRLKKWFIFDTFFTIGAFAFILSLGPAFQWGGHVIKHPFIIPLPYAFLYYVLPGFNGMRNSARWEMLFLLAFSICIAIFLSTIFKNRRNWLKALVVFVICFEVFWEFKWPYQYSSIPTIQNFPKVYYFINSLPKDKAIAEFPIFNWNTYISLNYIETTREYYSTLGFWKTFNGGAGFDPPPWQEKVTFLANNFPNKASLDLIKKQGINYIVLHKDEYNMMHNKKIIINKNVVPSADTINSELEKQEGLKLIYADIDSLVYKLN